MNATVEQSLMSKIRTLSPQQVAEVEDFVEFLATKARKSNALDRLLAIAPALEAAGAAPMSERRDRHRDRCGSGRTPGAPSWFNQQGLGCGSFLIPTWCCRR